MSIPIDLGYELDHRYRDGVERVYLTGTQALVRLLLLQRELDRLAGRSTAGFVSGYPGSPLGGFDLALQRATDVLATSDIRFQPAVNEDLAATSVWGTQQVPSIGNARVDGVFAMWYGKGPGVDRSVDAIRHGSQGGSSRFGGVLALAGDDHAARSSTTAHQSDFAFQHCLVPVLHPASVQEYLDLGVHGFALSRFAGCWVGFKCITDVVESAASVLTNPERFRVVLPDDVEEPPLGRNLRMGLAGQGAEELIIEHRLPAAQAYVRANGLDYLAFGARRCRLGIVTTGKAFLDVIAALDGLGINQARAERLGVGVFKVAMPWPLEPTAICAFARNCDEVLVVEEKRSLIEDQLARLLINATERPRLVGKTDDAGAPLVPSRGELTPAIAAQVIARRLAQSPGAGDAAELAELVVRAAPRPALVLRSDDVSLNRMPSFCSGCPHSTSTKLPEGSVAFSGIGCHGMAVWMPDRPTLPICQMGGEGAAWIGLAPFVDMPHVFQNLGDGTYFHSGLLAIRSAVAAGSNITYKILVNDAIAMTGGQQIQGQADVPAIVRQVESEGVARVVVVAEDPARWRGKLTRGVELVHRSDLDRVQRELRDTKGTTVIVYEQLCAAEKRRRRKRGSYPDPDRRVVINELVCEGCGDCNAQSSCISVEPVDTEFGRKRRINQSSCNKDYTCLDGYCPSFVTLVGATTRAPASAQPGAHFDDLDELVADLPEPASARIDSAYNVLVAGVGGTGVVTVGALLGVAAHLEGLDVSVLDVAGLAQKNGPVTSHIRLRPRAVRSADGVRIAAGGADVVIGCDIVVTAGAEALGAIGRDRSRLVLNSHVAPTADFAHRPDLDLSAERMVATLRRAAGAGDVELIDAAGLASDLLGDGVYTNMVLLGAAYQLGWLALQRASIERAIELNGVAVAANQRSFALGRLAVHAPAALARRAAGNAIEPDHEESSLDALIEPRARYLADYQNRAYADRYRGLVERVARAERDCVGETGELAEAVARAAFKLMAIKDEYEVARLLTSPEFHAGLRRDFDGDFKVRYNLAPQVLNPRTAGRARKRSFGPWLHPVLRVLARGRKFRGRPWDVFGRTEHRRRERALLTRYEADLELITARLDAATHPLAVELAALPERIRGYDTIKDRAIDEHDARRAELIDALAQLRGTPAGIGATP